MERGRSSLFGSEKEKGKQVMDYQLQKERRLSIKKGKRGIMRIVFGRTGILLGFLALQLLLLVLGLQYLAQYVHVFFGGHIVFGFFVLIIILNREENPVFQLTWAALALLLPAFGGLLYLYVELQPGTKVLAGRIRELDSLTETALYQNPDTVRALSLEDGRTAQLARYIWRTDGYPVYQNTQVCYFRSGEEKFDRLQKELLGAKNFIFLEYFIIAEGYMWDTVFEILRAKVKEGVEVRLIYDGMNELYNLPHHFPDRLKEAGIQCKVFSPVYPVISTHYNNRDHRKIVVIDGHTAFTGGVNLADEYINRKERFGHWKDAAIMLRGKAVRSFTVMFLRMWNIYEKLEDTERYLKEEPGLMTEHPGYVMPYAANPFSKERTAERIYIDILNSASQYVHIMTPYLVPGYEMMQAILYAARRGIDVKIILPHIPDKKYAFALAHSYYKKLIQSGVHVYEYTPGFIHSKVFVSDNIRAVVGAINLDYRSLYLNFECAAFLYKVPEICDVEADFRATLSKCQLVTMFDVKHDKWTRKLAGKFLKLMAPLM